MYQKLVIVGYLGRDPELRYTSSSTAVCNYSVATTRTWKNGDGSKSEETVWVKVSSWGKRAEIDGKYLKKGSLVLVEGRLNVDPETGGPRVWQDKEGTWRSSVEMTAETVKFLSKSGNDTQPEEIAF